MLNLQLFENFFDLIIFTRYRHYQHAENIIRAQEFSNQFFAFPYVWQNVPLTREFPDFLIVLVNLSAPTKRQYHQYPIIRCTVNPLISLSYTCAPGRPGLPSIPSLPASP